MTTQTEALNVALDVLRNSQDYKMGRAITVEAVEVIEEALAQPEQEPTGMLHIDRLDKWLDASLKDRKQRTAAEGEDTKAWVGLTDDEIMYMYNEPRSDAEMIAFGREIEAKLKEKNSIKE